MPEKIMSCLFTFLFYITIIISRFGERFGDGQYIFVSFSFAVFFLLTVLPRLTISKSGRGTCPNALRSPRQC